MKDKRTTSESGIRPGIRRLLRLDVARKDRIAAELEDELQMHLELRAEQLRKSGLSAEAAMHQARARYGAIDQAKSEIHQHAERTENVMRRRITIDSLMQDTRFAFRTLGRSKAWTAVAILTLALGIGANTAVFSVVNDLILDPLKYPNSDRNVFIRRHSKNVETAPTIEQLNSWHNAQSFESIEGFGGARQTLQVANGEPKTAHVAKVSPTFARFAGAHMLAGRFLVTDDARADALPVVVISEHIWHSNFGQATDVMGKTVQLDGSQFTVIGVMQDGVRIPSEFQESVDVWTTLPREGFLSGPAIGRLKKGVSHEQGEQELTRLVGSLDVTKNGINGSTFDIKVQSPGNASTTRDSVFLLAGAVSLLLLIACANVAHLLLARGAARDRELAIRAALGAGRARIVRQLVTESVLLASAGCIVGLLIGQAALRAMVSLRPASMEALANVQIDKRVLLATIAVSLVSGICFGLVAAFSARSGSNFEALRSSIASTSGRNRHRFRSLLVVTENALSVVLLIGAVMLIRTVINLYTFNPGFDATGVYAQSFTLPETRYGSAPARQMYADQLLDRVRAIPGVSSATFATSPPGRSGAMIGHWVAEGAATPPAKPGEMEFTAVNTVRADYFNVIGMPFVRGRSFSANARDNHELIVSVAMALRLWGDTNVIGRRLHMESASTANLPTVWSVVVGVAPNASLMSLMDRGSTPYVYFPMETDPDQRATLFVRMKSGAAPAAELRRAFLSTDGAISPPELVSIPDLLMRTFASQRFLMALLTLFATLAVALSAIGLYGVITYMVSQSTREIGVRVALGAGRRDVIRLVMLKGATLSVLGLGLGLIGAIWSARLLQHLLFGVTSHDPGSYALGAGLLLSIALGACIAPTMRALRIDPMLAMRSD